MRTTILTSRVAQAILENPKRIQNPDKTMTLMKKAVQSFSLKNCDENFNLIRKMEGSAKAKYYANTIIGDYYNQQNKLGPPNFYF